MSLPSVSIVTPTFNSAAYLEEAIESIHSQGYAPLEHWVIDAESTDGSLGILRRHAGKLQWISEPDRGQSDAINKGFRRCRGEIVAWLNGDDAYEPEAIARGVAALSARPDLGMAYGGAVLIDAEGRRVAERPPEPFDRQRLLGEGDYIAQPAVFMRRSVLERVGLLREDLHFCMDYDLWLRLSAEAPVGVIEGEPMVRYRLHADSKTTYIPYGMVSERYQVAEEHDGRPLDVALKVLAIKWSQHANEDWAEGPRAFDARHLEVEDYWRLPAALRRRARPDLAEARLQAGFRAKAAGRPGLAAAWMRAGLRADPLRVADRGVLAVLARGFARGSAGPASSSR